MYFLLKIVIFQCHVSFQGCIRFLQSHVCTCLVNPLKHWLTWIPHATPGSVQSTTKWQHGRFGSGKIEWLMKWNIHENMLIAWLLGLFVGWLIYLPIYLFFYFIYFMYFIHLIYSICFFIDQISISQWSCDFSRVFSCKVSRTFWWNIIFIQIHWMFFICARV